MLACHLQIDEDPDPACHVDADPDPTFQFDLDPDTQHRLHFFLPVFGDPHL